MKTFNILPQLKKPWSIVDFSCLKEINPTYVGTQLAIHINFSFKNHPVSTNKLFYYMYLHLYVSFPLHHYNLLQDSIFAHLIMLMNNAFSQQDNGDESNSIKHSIAHFSIMVVPQVVQLYG